MTFQISLGMAVIGFAVGLTLGNRITSFDRNLPFTAGIAGAVVFYLAAQVLLIAAAATVFALSAWIVIRAWPTVHAAVVEFGRQSGLRISNMRPVKSFADRLDAMHGEYQHRAASIRNLELHRDDIDECIEMAETRLAEEIKALANSPYDQDNLR